MKVSPGSAEYEKLNDFAVNCLYEVIMNYPEEAVRTGYLHQNTGVLASVNRNVDKLREMGYSEEDIRAMQGKE